MTLDDLLTELKNYGYTVSRRAGMGAVGTMIQAYAQRLSVASGVPIEGLTPREYGEVVARLKAECEELDSEATHLRAACLRMRRRVNRALAILATPCLTERTILASRATMYRPCVYGLVDPRKPDDVRYVGQATNPYSRYTAHCQAGSIRVSAWVEKLEAEDEAPAMLLLEECAESQLDDRESHWIAHYKGLGLADLNMIDPSARRLRRVV